MKWLISLRIKVLNMRDLMLHGVLMLPEPSGRSP
jgi:hypothetical protein